MRYCLIKIRIDKGYTQSQIANKIKISRPFYSKIETGHRSPSLKVAIAIKAALGYENDDIFDNTKIK